MTTEADVEAVLAAARRGFSPTAADQERVRRLTEAALRAAAGAPSAAASSSTVATRAWPWVGRVLTAGLIAGAAAGLGYRAGWRAGRADAVSPVSASLVDASPAAASPAPLAPKATSEVVPSPSPGRPSSHAMTPRRAPTNGALPAGDSLAEEVRVLRSVERALREGSPGFALALLRELDRAVPRGALTEERQAMRAIARCTGGDVPFGVNLAHDFAEHFPASVYGQRVEDACAATDSSASGDQERRRKSP